LNHTLNNTFNKLAPKVPKQKKYEVPRNLSSSIACRLSQQTNLKPKPSYNNDETFNDRSLLDTSSVNNTFAQLDKENVDILNTSNLAKPPMPPMIP
jgi:hypothetical protein